MSERTKTKVTATATATATAMATAMATVATTVVTTTATAAETYWKECVCPGGKVINFELLNNSARMAGENWISSNCEKFLWSKEDDKYLVLSYKGKRHFDSQSRIRVKLDGSKIVQCSVKSVKEQTHWLVSNLPNVVSELFPLSDEQNAKILALEQGVKTQTFVFPDREQLVCTQLKQTPEQEAFLKLNQIVWFGDTYLIISDEDRELISDPNMTHHGAFGSDFKRIGFIGNQIIDGGETHWLIWKIPSDISNVITMPENVFLQVGTYSLFDDVDLMGKDPSDTLEAERATKLRKVTPDGRHIHKLKLGDGSLLAMVSSSILLKGGLGGDPKVLCAIAEDLNTKFGLDVFSCHLQHHALVFRQSPLEFAITLNETPGIITCLVTHAPAYEKERIERWGEGFIKEFL